MTEFRYRDVSEALPHLMREVMDGEEVGSRGGQRTKELLHTYVVLEQPWRREVLVPGRKASLAAQIAETMWVLAGRNDIGWLSHYLPRAAEFSDDGKTWRGGYGPRLRAWDTNERGVDGPILIDQLAHVVDLLRRDPTSRRAVMAIYDPAVDAADGKDIPCNDFLMFSSRLGHLHLSVHTRSNDLMWGWSGINAFEWSALQEIVAGLLGLRVGELHFSINSLHLYDRHWEKAERLADPERVFVWDPRCADSPRFSGSVSHNFGPEEHTGVEGLDDLIIEWFSIEHAIRNNDRDGGGWTQRIEAFPEPMMQSWLRVIAWHWTGDEGFLAPLAGTALHQAALWSPQVIHRVPNHHQHIHLTEKDIVPKTDPFTEYVVGLHDEKHAAYGDSWKRRGEMLGILANIARKVDRLGGSETADETSADTAIDLLVYLVKYRLWLTEKAGASAPFSLRPDEGFRWAGLTDEPWPVRVALRYLGKPEEINGAEAGEIAEQLKKDFDRLEQLVVDKMLRWVHVDRMINRAHRLAGHLWSEQQPASPKHSFEAFEGSSGMACTRMVMRDGGGDQCGHPADDTSVHLSAVPLSERNATRAWSGYGE